MDEKENSVFSSEFDEQIKLMKENGLFVSGDIDTSDDIPDMEISDDITEETSQVIEKEKEKEDTSGVNIDLNTPYPHFCIPKATLLDAFALGSSLINPSAKPIVLQSLNILPDKENKEIVLMTFNDYNLYKYRFPISDEDANSLIDQNFSIRSTLFLKLVPLMDNQVLFYKVNDESDENYGKIFVRLMDGDLLLADAKPEESYLNEPDEKGEKLFDLNTSSIGEIINVMLPLINLDIRPANQKITLDGKNAYYNSAIYTIRGTIESLPLLLKRGECLYLKQLASKYKNEVISIYKVKNSTSNRYLLQCSNTEFTFINGDSTVNEQVFKALELANENTFVSVNYNQLLRVVSLAVALYYATGRVGLRFTHDCLEATIPTNQGESCFKVNYLDGAPDSLQSEPIYVPANELKKLLQSFSNYEGINISIDSKMISIKTDTFLAVFMHKLS